MRLAALIAFSLLLATWVGYPLAIRLLAPLRRARQGDSADANRSITDANRSITVVIASHNDAAAIRTRVEDVLTADYPADLVRVVVALDALSARATEAELAHLDPRVTVIRGDAEGGKASSLNAAVRVATSDLLVFTDTAQRFDRQAIRQLAADFDDASLGASSGMLEISSGSKTLNLAERYWRYERWLRHWEHRLDSTVGVTGAVYALRRELWPTLRAGLILDDVYVPMDIVLRGWRVGFNRRAIAYDDRRFTAAEEYRRKVRTLTGVIQLCVWRPAILNPFRNRIFLQFVFHKLCRLLTPYLTILVALGVAWEVVRMATASPEMLRGALVAMGALAASCLVPAVRRRVTSQLSWAYALQRSAFVATINGVRGCWEVWN